MGIIQQLAPHEVHKIAAGEVIERPANIAKELIENALDAGATHITVYAHNGGKESIRIIDNGSGMARDDAHLCFAHHATSKITSIDDLETIDTFGFRGEALSSISAISNVTLITKDTHEQEGIKLLLKNGEIISQELVAAPVGTDITIDSIFNSVPARKKFLKSDETEWRAVYQLCQAYAMAHPEVSFKIFHNEKLILQCTDLVSTHVTKEQSSENSESFSKETVLPRLCQVFDGHTARALIKLVLTKPEDVTKDFMISGFISNQQVMRYDRSSIFLFVNKRWIKNPKLVHSYIKGYSGVLPKGRYPVGILFIDIDKKLVDINTHPRKEEVTFLNPRRVELALEQAVAKTLAQATSQQFYIPDTYQDNQTNLNTQSSTNLFFNSSFDTQDNQIGTQTYNKTSEPKLFTLADSELIGHTKKRPENLADTFNINNKTTHTVNQIENLQETNFTFLGQLYNTYFLIQTHEGLVIIDQHAAHECVLYEQFCTQNPNQQDTQIPLLFPPIITLNNEEKLVYEKHITLFESHGIMLDAYGEYQYALKSVPIELKNSDVTDLIKSILSDLNTQNIDQNTQKNLYHSIRARMACKAAVKAGDTLTHEHAQQLIKSLLKTEQRTTCPHGRPTTRLITLYELERMFKRKI